ncbi:MAG: M48 family metalloprotease [Spirosomaceae bacterium]|nr:M48 family metalloprotease [Spirosomataceae bacterium]
MKKLFEIIDSNVMAATGWTLIHSVWQSIAILLVISTLSYFLKPKAIIKYWLNVAGLSLQLFVSFFTFLWIFEPSQTQSLSPSLLLNFVIINQAGYASGNLSFIEEVRLLITTNLELIVNVWLFGVAVLLIRFLMSYWYVNTLKIDGISHINPKTDEVFRGLVIKMNFKKAIQVFESSKITVPMVVGHIKPIILLPVGLATGLTMRQLEAVLAHELAHIKRHDFLVNLLQSIVEILFFFNPAVWFISNQIRKERENCCDDVAVSVTGDKLLLVKALAQIETYRNEPSLAMAFGRRKYTLLERVQRILGISRTKSISYETFLGILAFSVVFGIYLTYQKVTAQTAPKTNKNEITKSIMLTDSTKKRTATFQIGKNVRVTDNGEVLVESYKIKVSPEDSAKLAYHQNELEKLQAQMEPYQGKMQALGKEMQAYGQKIQAIYLPINQKSSDMGEIGNQIGKLSRQKVRLEFDLEDSRDDKTRKELKAKLKETDDKLREIENKMESYHKEIEKFHVQNEKLYEIPMDSLSKLMQAYEEPLEKIAKQMEFHGEAIEKLIPEGARYNNFGNWVSPPSPPSYPSVPEKPKKALKASPVSPPSPPKPVKRT